MESLIKYWRFLFDNNFYFFYVQIAPYKYKDNYAHFLREQQELVLDRLDRIGMINISDLVTDVKDLHPKNKRGIGERLAHMALDKAYNNFDKAYEDLRLKDLDLSEEYCKNEIEKFKGATISNQYVELVTTHFEFIQQTYLQ